MSTPTSKELINASMAFLPYMGSSLAVDATTVFQVAKLIDDALPTYPNLNNDWRIVWGPALYCSDELSIKKQANLTFVAQSQSTPSSYIVATRGTVLDNVWEWLTENLKVDFEPWPTAMITGATGYVSEATADALKVVLDTCPPTLEQTPGDYPPLPGAGQSLASYLAGLTGNGAIDICFTGHSLGGAIAPALALWFKQAQGNARIPSNTIYYPMPSWDIDSVARISCVSFAGATPGDTAFSAYFEQQLGANYERIYNTNDVVPHGFAELSKVPELYEPTITMSEIEKLALDAIEHSVKKAQQRISSVYSDLPNSKPFTYPLNTTSASFASETDYQHMVSYRLQFGLPITSKKPDDKHKGFIQTLLSVVKKMLNALKDLF